MRPHIRMISLAFCLILCRVARSELNSHLLQLPNPAETPATGTVVKDANASRPTVSWSPLKEMNVHDMDLQGEHYREYRIDKGIFVVKLRQTQPLHDFSKPPNIDTSHVYCAQDAKAAKLRAEASLPAEWKLFIETLRSDCKDMMTMPKEALRAYRIGIGTQNAKTGATREGYYIPVANQLGFSATW